MYCDYVMDDGSKCAKVFPCSYHSEPKDVAEYETMGQVVFKLQAQNAALKRIIQDHIHRQEAIIEATNLKFNEIKKGGE